MSFRIYKEVNALVIVNTVTWRNESHALSQCWFEFVSTEAPIIYSIYKRAPETNLILNQPYTSFTDQFGNSFADDLELQTYLREVIYGRDSASLDSGAQLDAGGRLRVSQITTLLDIKQFNDNQPLFYDREVIGGSTQVYTKNLGGVTMSVSSNLDAAIVQSKMFANYFAGKTQLGEVTFSGFQNQTDVTKRAGYFSSNTSTPFNSNKDGLWFESDGTNYKFKIEKNGVEILDAKQSEWNLNTLVGFDPSKFQVFVFQFLYLGGTAVKFGFIVNGAIEWCHIYKHAGLVASTFVESPNQPVRYEIRSDGGSGSMDQICASVASEGAVDDVGVNRSFDVEDFQANSGGTNYAVMGLRLKSSYRNISIKVNNLSLLAQTNDDFIWRACLNPTIAGTFTYNDQTNSSLQLAEGATANTVSDFGTIVGSGNGTGGTQSLFSIPSALRIGSQIDGTMDELVLVVTPITNGLDIFASAGIQEFI